VLHIALPVLNEYESLPQFLSCLAGQAYGDYRLYVCVNQPDEWWSDAIKRAVCEDNQRTIHFLQEQYGKEICLIDRSSPGKGWIGRKHGVGWARKTVMDRINEEAGEEDIIISLDADATCGNNYFLSVKENFERNPDAVALAVPYFHKPVADPEAYRAILRYEIYMRHYSINLWRIGSPYTFTALGSAMACPVRAYRAIGGMTPRMSGEDFYFLQKLRKYGKMLFHNPEKVYPAARFSDRVYFGTGPAMIKGNAGDWSSYPVYPVRFFDEIRETYDLVPDLFEKTISTPVTVWLREVFREEDPFRPLRENASTRNQFVRAFHEKFDGLRILQYLKERNRLEPGRDEDNLKEFLLDHYPENDKNERIAVPDHLDFLETSLEELETIRMFLVNKEEEYQVSSALSSPGRPLPGG
jgi:hypothetical protein